MSWRQHTKLPMCTKHPRCRLGPCAAVARPAAVCVRVDPPRAKVGARWLNPAVAKLCEMGLKKAPKIFACGASFPHRKLRLHDCWTPPTRVLRLPAREASSAHGHVSGGKWQGLEDGWLYEEGPMWRLRATSRPAPHPGSEDLVLTQHQLDRVDQLRRG